MTLTRKDVFGPNSINEEDEFLTLADWTLPVQYFVGRNGTGKSRAAKAVCERLNGRLLSTDRLVGLMNFINYGWGATPSAYKGVPLGNSEREQIHMVSKSSGTATAEMYALREEPEVWLRVAAFIRRALGRSIELRESAGFLDPYIRIGNIEYSLLRDEGHGLRELVVLLTATYKKDWPLLVVDEPELHLHPSMARLWLTELNRECLETRRKAIIVTHEPSFLRPTRFLDLNGIWVFSSKQKPQRVADCAIPAQEPRVEASLAQNPSLMGEIVFSPRPVLVEGSTDVAALKTCLARQSPPEVTAQTDIVDCGGRGGVGLWTEICVKLDLDVRAVADLDSLFSNDFQRAIDSLPGVRSALLSAFAEDPPQLSTAVRPLITAANRAQIGKSEADRADWLAAVSSENVGTRKAKLLELLKEHGVWLHPQGTLEQVLGIGGKGVPEARAAANQANPLDAVAAWASYDLDLSGDLATMLEVAVERIAHTIMQGQRNEPEIQFNAPVGTNAEFDSRLVTVRPVDGSRHRIEVIAPKQFSGYWLEFSRETPSTELNLQPPTHDGR